jgi:hypothetical protein
VLTSWLRDLREVADAAQTSQGRRERAYVRIPIILQVDYLVRMI